MKAVVATFNQEKALVGAFSVITNLRIEFGWNFLKHYAPRSRKIVIWAFQLYLTTTNDWFKFKMHYLHVKTNYNILTSKRKFYRKKQYVPRHLPKINRVTVPENPEWSIIFLPNGPIWMLVERISSALLCCIRHGRHSVSGWSLISCCRQHAARILTRTDLCHHTTGVSAAKKTNFCRTGQLDVLWLH